MSTTDTGTNHPNAEVRGKLRLWKEQLAHRYTAVDKLMAGNVIGKAVASLVTKTGTGRRRAFDSIVAAVKASGAVLECVSLDGPHPIAVWTVLKPRVALDLEPDHPANAQHCITVNYIAIGRLRPEPIGYIGEGIWSLELPDHAIGQMMARSPGTDPAAAILEAHHATLRLRHRDIVDESGGINTVRGLPIPAGPGAFLCDPRGGHDVSTDEPILHLFAGTWISDDQLRADQVKLFDDGGPGERLVDSWLLPVPMRHAVAIAGDVIVLKWRSLPLTLAGPAGRA